MGKKWSQYTMALESGSDVILVNTMFFCKCEGR